MFGVHQKRLLHYRNKVKTRVKGFRVWIGKRVITNTVGVNEIVLELLGIQKRLLDVFIIFEQIWTKSIEQQRNIFGVLACKGYWSWLDIQWTIRTRTRDYQRQQQWSNSTISERTERYARNIPTGKRETIEQIVRIGVGEKECSEESGTFVDDEREEREWNKGIGEEIGWYEE